MIETKENFTSSDYECTAWLPQWTVDMSNAHVQPSSSNNCCCYCFGPWVLFYKLCSHILQTPPPFTFLSQLLHLVTFTCSCCQRAKPAAAEVLEFLHSTPTRLCQHTTIENLKLSACGSNFYLCPLKASQTSRDGKQKRALEDFWI